MLRCLHITNLAIVRDLTLDLGAGLNLLTGETGAGKSILVDALALVVGGRSGPEMIRAGAERASVEAELDVSSNRAARAFLEERGYPVEAGTIVARRDILAQGKGRAFLGGSLAALSDLRALGAILVDLHGQHQQQTLLHALNHRDLLDRHAGLDGELDDMAGAAQKLAAATARLLSLREGAQRLLQRTDALRYLIDEVVTVAPRPGERESLRAEREILRNAETILRHARAAYEALYEGEGAAGRPWRLSRGASRSCGPRRCAWPPCWRVPVAKRRRRLSARWRESSMTLRCVRALPWTSGRARLPARVCGWTVRKSSLTRRDTTWWNSSCRRTRESLWPRWRPSLPAASCRASCWRSRWC